MRAASAGTFNERSGDNYPLRHNHSSHHEGVDNGGPPSFADNRFRRTGGEPDIGQTNDRKETTVVKKGYTEFFSWGNDEDG